MSTAKKLRKARDGRLRAIEQALPPGQRKTVSQINDDLNGAIQLCMYMLAAAGQIERTGADPLQKDAGQVHKYVKTAIQNLKAAGMATDRLMRTARMK